MSKFKVGQKVRFTKACSGFDFGDIGAENTIGKIYYTDDYGAYIDVLNNELFIKGSNTFSLRLNKEIRGYCFLSDVYDSIKPLKSMECCNE